MSIESLEMEQAIELGIYVWIGQHEIEALKACLKQSAEADKKEYQTVRIGFIHWFPERNIEAFRKIKFAGNFQNNLNDMRQDRGFVAKLMDIRYHFKNLCLLTTGFLKPEKVKIICNKIFYVTCNYFNFSIFFRYC